MGVGLACLVGAGAAYVLPPPFFFRDAIMRGIAGPAIVASLGVGLASAPKADIHAALNAFGFVHEAAAQETAAPEGANPVPVEKNTGPSTIVRDIRPTAILSASIVSPLSPRDDYVFVEALTNGKAQFVAQLKYGSVDVVTLPLDADTLILRAGGQIKEVSLPKTPKRAPIVVRASVSTQPTTKGDFFWAIGGERFGVVSGISVSTQVAK